MPYRKSKKWGKEKPPVGTLLDFGHPLTKGIVGAWLFSESAGGKLFDSSPYASQQRGVLTGGTWKNGGLSFNGSSNKVTVDAIGALNNSTVTVVALINLAATSAGMGIVNAGDEDNAGNPFSYHFKIAGAGNNNVVWHTRDNSGNADTVTGSIALTTGRDYLVAGGREQVTGNSKIWVNGIVDGTGFPPANALRSPTLFQIGVVRYAGTDGTWFNGLLKMVMIYNRYLRTEEVQAFTTAPYQLWRPPLRRIISGVSSSAPWSYQGTELGAGEYAGAEIH